MPAATPSASSSWPSRPPRRPWGSPSSSGCTAPGRLSTSTSSTRCATRPERAASRSRDPSGGPGLFMRHTTLSCIPDRLPLLVVGDLMLDEYLRGAVSRISPEAPVPVLESVASEQALGGAANVAANLALGAQVAQVGAV